MQKIPIVYSKAYNIAFFGLEKLHPFDSKKYGKVHRYLIEKGLATADQFHEPEPITREDLLEVHTEQYLKSLKKSKVVARIAEQGWARSIPNFLLQWKFLKPMKYGTGGTLLASELALKHGWAINLSGGYHHAKGDRSSGFCFYADIPLAGYRLLKNHPHLKKIFVLDLDAHQGNGFESIFKDDPRFVTMDVYNGDIYPLDGPARKFIKYNFPIESYTGTNRYCNLVATELPKALDAEQPDYIIYNAGTDIYEKDPLGSLHVADKGVLLRDKIVFEEAIKRKIPILMLLSGGYTMESAGLIGSSIKYLNKKFGLLDPFKD